VLTVGVDLQGVSETAGDGGAKAGEHGRALALVQVVADDFDAAPGRVQARYGAANRLFIAVIDDEDRFAVLSQAFRQRRQRRGVPIAWNDRAQAQARTLPGFGFSAAGRRRP
jgi:hypothetical protein